MCACMCASITNLLGNIFISQDTFKVSLVTIIYELYNIIKDLYLNVFKIPEEKINLFYDESTNIIGFNNNNDIFLNISYHIKCNFKDTDTNPKFFWYVIICHELAHNLERNHNINFIKIFENILISNLTKM